MPKFSVSYTYADPSPEHPNATRHGCRVIDAEDEDDARYRLTGHTCVRNVKGLHIKAVEVL